MPKRGSCVLRYALVYAAHNIVRHNDVFRSFYDAKRSQGKNHYNAFGIVQESWFALLSRC